MDGSISFLDCQLQRTNSNALSVSVHRKATHTDKYLNLGSHHPVHVKQGVVKSLFDRAWRVVKRESDLREEEKHLKQVLVNNGYPQPFIDENSRVRSVRPSNEETSTPLVVIPYVSGLSEDIRRICRRFGVRVVFKSAWNEFEISAIQIKRCVVTFGVAVWNSV